MAKKTVTTLVDDIDGGVATETVSFSLDGTSYEIDLSSENASALRAAFEPYSSVARKSGRSVASRVKSATGGREDLSAAREWLRGQGHKVSDRGRIPANLLAEYRSAN